MSFIAMTNAQFQQMLQNDAQQMRSFIAWLQERNTTYSQNCSTANMNAATISGGDQTTILAFAADLARLVTFCGGTLPGVASNISIDITNVLGML
jgi:hypothetical protein